MLTHTSSLDYLLDAFLYLSTLVRAVRALMPFALTLCGATAKDQHRGRTSWKTCLAVRQKSRHSWSVLVGANISIVLLRLLQVTYVD